MTNLSILILPGDGIGPEVTRETGACLRKLDETAGIGVEFEDALLGGGAVSAGVAGGRGG